MKNYNRRILQVLIPFLMITAVVGCSHDVEETTVEITLMHGWGGTPKTHKIMNEIYEDFHSVNPDIQLNCVPYATSDIAVKQANDMLAVGKMPDIIGTNGLSYYLNNVVKEDKALDIMPYIEADPEWKADISPTVFETWVTENDNMYTLPDVLEVAGYWVNEQIFQEAGITDEDGNAVIPSTWSEFMQTVERLQEWIDNSGSNISVFALEDAQNIEFLFLARLAAEGQNGLDAAKSSDVKIEEATLRAVMEDIREISSHSQWVDNVENARQLFFEGRSIIYFNGIWESDILKDSPNASCFHYANYPGNDGKSIAYISPSSGYIIAKQDNKEIMDAELRFLKYMLSDKVQTKIAVDTGQAPVNPNIDIDLLIQKSPMFGKAIKEAYNAEIKIKTIYSVWSQTDIATVRNYLSQNMRHLDYTEDMLSELNRDVD